MGLNPQHIAATTRICAVYGHPVKHSASPAMHNTALAALGLDWKYLACDVHPENLRAAIKGAQAMKFIGLNLTVPHKLLALEIVDELDESARTWGAVNTILFEARAEPGGWKPLRMCDPDQVLEMRGRGFNTDADAITRSIREDLHLELPGATGVILGAGGAGRTAALKLASDGVKNMFLVNRTTSKAEELAREIQARFPAVSVEIGYPDLDPNPNPNLNRPITLVLNATSLGLKPSDPLPFDLARFSLKQCDAAYDMIYRPSETPFLAQAKKAGCRIANGLGMLLYQGAKALEIWAGQPAPIELMRAALKEHIYGK